MNQLTVEEGHVPLNLDDITYVQEKFGITFPSDLISFLNLYQGAITSECEFAKPTPYDPENAILLSSFYEVKCNDENYSMERWLENYNELKKERPKYDQGMWLPISSDICSNNICYSLNTDSFGQIFFYEPFAGSDQPFSFICNSLEEFVNGLYNPYQNDPV